MEDIKFCIEYLKKINDIKLNIVSFNLFDTFRAYENITMPVNLSDEFYLRSDNVIKEEYKKKRIVDVNTLDFMSDRISIYKGDITCLKADAIVNACNSELLGCFSPLHSCIDNAIHSYAGLQMRRDLIKIMNEQGHSELNGMVKVTKGYNLPSLYVFHTVGPQVIYRVTEDDKNDLRNCYLSCLKKASEMKLKNIVFCSISTGVYGYPIEEASKIAVSSVKEFLKEDTTLERVVFNVFSEGDYNVYNRRIKELN